MAAAGPGLTSGYASAQAIPSQAGHKGDDPFWRTVTQLLRPAGPAMSEPTESALF